MTIRPALPGDDTALEVLTRDAFWDVYRPGCNEHYLVHVLHEQNACALELVAEQDGSLIGHAACVQAELHVSDGRVLTDVLCLGPLTVGPAWQRQGIGSALMARTIALAREQGFRAIFLTGNPAYYGRFGYRPTTDYGVTLPDGSSFPELMVLPLYDGALDGLTGTYEDPAIYAALPEEAVDAFDRQFPPREKHKLPTQLFS
ncbi:MAG: GNAT family N-acetyltransferase [Aristaeellaceae bacterium]